MRAPIPVLGGPLRALVPDQRQARTLALASLVNTFGRGMFLAGGPIVLVRSVGLSANQVGLGLTIAGSLALGAGLVGGASADRRGPRQAMIAGLLVEAAATALLAFTHSFLVFLVAVIVAQGAGQGSRSARAAMIALLGGEEGRVRLRAQLRAVTNVGISLGTLVAGASLALDTRAGYVALLLLDTATFVAAAAIVARLPALRSARADETEPAPSRWRALSDRPYLAATAVNGVLTLNFAVLEIGLPLWVSEHTSAPRWLVTPLLLINTIAVTALQVRASRGVDSPARAARAMRRSGVAFLAAFALLGLAAGEATWLAIALLALGMVVHTAGELVQSAGSFEVGFGLAHPAAQGQYQGVFQLGFGVTNAVGPLLVTAVCLGGGLAGFVALGAVLALAGAAAPAVVGWAERTRTWAVAA